MEMAMAFPDRPFHNFGALKSHFKNFNRLISRLFNREMVGGVVHFWPSAFLLV